MKSWIAKLKTLVNGQNVFLALQTKSSQFQLVLASLLKYKDDCLVELMLLDG
jgi:hypothetical protein